MPSGQAADPEQESMGRHQEDPLPSVLGEEGPGDSGGVPSGDADGGVGEDQRHHPSGRPGDHGPADRGVIQDALPQHTHHTPFFSPLSVFLSLSLNKKTALGQKQADTPHTLPCSVFLLKKAGGRPLRQYDGGGGERKGKPRRKKSQHHKNQLNQLKREQEHGVSFYVVSFDV